MRAQAKGLEQDDQGEARLLKQFRDEIEQLKRNPVLQTELRDGMMQVAMYGSAGVGPRIYADGAMGFLLP